MGCLLGGSQNEGQPSRVNKDDKAIAELKITRDKVKTYQRKLETNIEHCKQAVKQCIKKKNKDRALLALRKQKFLDKNLETTRGELLTLEVLINDIENAQIQKNIYDSLKKGNEFLQNINQQLTLDDVEKLMEETFEAVEYQQKVSEALSQQGLKQDDKDLLKELERLDSLEALEVDLPNAPTNKLQQMDIEGPEKEERKVSSKRQQVLLA
ncbi:unnamed protein product [Blepharisma stoltei]|uniref:Charged multivesicular body protein 6 n=1 Tax=Blepharisma stoltei TaxID=1481888 RepID=A0AAU9IX18_9CILI|nr:unnamed protein product [Blepharisma stoltei]